MLSRWCGGMSIRDWAWLARADELRGNLYVVCSSSLTASPPRACDLIPWRVLLLLGSYSKKHCFLTSKCFPNTVHRRATKRLSTTIKWVWHFKDSSIDDPQRGDIRPLIKREPRSYPGLSTKEIEAFHSGITRVVAQHFKRANASIRRRLQQQQQHATYGRKFRTKTACSC